MLRVAWDQLEAPGVDGVANAEMLSTKDAAWLRRISYSGWKDLKLHFSELEALRCRAEGAGMGANACPVLEKRLAILKTIVQMQHLLGKKQIATESNGQDVKDTLLSLAL